jgi:broad specificity phosphatase PhoE
MVAFFEAALARFTTGRLLFVSHGAALGLLLYHLVGVEHGTHGRRLAWRTDNCALHRLRRGDDGLLTVVALNDRAHLRDL